QRLCSARQAQDHMSWPSRLPPKPRSRCYPLCCVIFNYIRSSELFPFVPAMWMAIVPSLPLSPVECTNSWWDSTYVDPHMHGLNTLWPLLLLRSISLSFLSGFRPLTHARSRSERNRLV